MRTGRRDPGGCGRAVAAGALALVALWGSGAIGDEGAKIRLRVGYFQLDTTAGTVQAKVNARIVGTFQERHPEYEIVPATGITVPGQTMDIAPLMQIAGNIPPDLLYVNMRKSETYISQGLLYALDDLIDEAMMADLRQRLHPRVWDVIRRRGPDGEMHIWCIPVGQVISGLMYRRDWQKQAGLPDRGPETWEELIAWSKKIIDPSRGRFGLGLSSQARSLGYECRHFLWATGADYMKQVGPAEAEDYEAAFNSPEAVESAVLMLRLFREKWEKDGKAMRGYVLEDSAQYEMEIVETAYGTRYLHSQWLSDINPEVTGIAAIPASADGTRGAELNCLMYGLFAGLPKWRREAAWKFLKYYTSREVEKIRTDVMVENGYGQFVQPDALKRYGYNDIYRLLSPEWLDAYRRSWESAVPEPYQKNCDLIYGEIGRPLSQIMTDPGIERLYDEGKMDELRARIGEILDEGVRITNEKMVGKVAPEVMKRRIRVARVFLIVSIAAMAGAMVHIIRALTPAALPGQKRVRWQLGKHWRAYLMLVPAVGLVALWQYYPLARGMLMAFQDYRIMGDHRWVGLVNFAQVLFDPQFWNAMWVTIEYGALMLGLGFLLPFVLAIMLAELPRGTVLFRTLFYLPAVISGLIVVFLWRYFFQPYGLLNQVVSIFGIHTTKSWLNDNNLAILCCVLPTIWAGTGPGCLIYLAALKTVPPDLYESAQIDGAGFLHRIGYIVFPSLKGLLIINFVGAVVGAFRSVGFIFAMTGGGPYTPYGRTEVIGLQIFYNAFLYLKFGFATAMAWILGSLLIGFTIMQLKRLSRMEFKTADSPAR